MILTDKEIEGLMRLVGLTRDEEINCEQCFVLLSEFAEQELAGKTIPEGLECVEHHLAVCTECRDEYEVLQNALRQMNK